MARKFNIRWEHLIFVLFMYIDQLHKEIRQSCEWWAVAVPSMDQIVYICLCTKCLIVLSINGADVFVKPSMYGGL